jgi:hypothetical protein
VSNRKWGSEAERLRAYRQEKKLQAEEAAEAWRKAHPKKQDPSQPIPKADKSSPGLVRKDHKIWDRDVAPEPPRNDGKSWRRVWIFYFRCECNSYKEHGPYYSEPDRRWAAQKHCLDAPIKEESLA